MGDDARVRSGHVRVIFEDQVAGGPAQGGFRLIEFELRYNFTIQFDVLKLGGERSLLQLGDGPHRRAPSRLPC